MLAHHAGDRRRHFDRDLVGLQADDGLVGLDRITRLFQPFADGCLDDRFTQYGHVDFGCHFHLVIPAKAGIS
jgi:hypothetical protein